MISKFVLPFEKEICTSKLENLTVDVFEILATYRTGVKTQFVSKLLIFFTSPEPRG